MRVVREKLRILSNSDETTVDDEARHQPLTSSHGPYCAKT